jgi:hypothetical protein
LLAQCGDCQCWCSSLKFKAHLARNTAQELEAPSPGADHCTADEVRVGEIEAQNALCQCVPVSLAAHVHCQFLSATGSQVLVRPTAACVDRCQAASDTTSVPTSPSATAERTVSEVDPCLRVRLQARIPLQQKQLNRRLEHCTST